MLCASLLFVASDEREVHELRVYTNLSALLVGVETVFSTCGVA